MLKKIIGWLFGYRRLVDQPHSPDVVTRDLLKMGDDVSDLIEKQLGKSMSFGQRQAVLTMAKSCYPGSLLTVTPEDVVTELNRFWNLGLVFFNNSDLPRIPPKRGEKPPFPKSIHRPESFDPKAKRNY